MPVFTLIVGDGYHADVFPLFILLLPSDHVGCRYRRGQELIVVRSLAYATFGPNFWRCKEKRNDAYRQHQTCTKFSSEVGNNADPGSEWIKDRLQEAIMTCVQQNARPYAVSCEP